MKTDRSIKRQLMVYNPVIIILPVKGDGMVDKIARHLTGKKSIPNANSRLELKKKYPVWRKLMKKDNNGGKLQ